MKIYVLNLVERSKERKTAMLNSFVQEELTFIKAVDGFKWAAKKKDAKGQPEWKAKDRAKLVKDGILIDDSTLPPTHVACNQSHLLAIDMFLDGTDPVCVIMEDDIKPTKVLSAAWSSGKTLSDIVRMPEGCDLFYLCSSDHSGMRVSTYRDGQIRKVRTLMGYMITRKGAEAFKAAAFPMKWLYDFQVPISCYESLRDKQPKDLPEHMREVSQIKACALASNGFVELSPLASDSLLGHRLFPVRKPRKRTADK